MQVEDVTVEQHSVYLLYLHKSPNTEFTCFTSTTLMQVEEVRVEQHQTRSEHARVDDHYHLFKALFRRY
jgi:hypothetical protein